VKKKTVKRKNKNKKSPRRNSRYSGGIVLLPFQQTGGWKFNAVALLLFSVIGIIIYSNTFLSPFQFDDTLQILAKDRVKDLAQFSSVSEWLKVSRRTASFFSFALNFKFGEYNVLGYHITNLLIHILNAFLVFLLTLQIFRTPLMKKRSFSPLRNHIAIFTALIFLVHPIQTQGVTYIVQRMTSQSALFYMISILFFVKARLSFIASSSKLKIFIWFVLSGIAAVFSLLSKQIAVTLPFTFLLYEFCFIRNKEGKHFTKFLSISGAGLIIGLLVVLIGGMLPAETRDISRANYLFTQFRVMVKYIQLLILPINQNLDYEFTLSNTFFSYKVILSLFLLFLIAGLGVLAYKKHRIIAFGIFWFFITLSVESSIIPIRDVIFEHRLYLPMFGFSLILSYAAWRFIGIRNSRIAIAALTGIVLVLSFATYARNKTWKSQYTLWKDVAQKSPGKSRVWYNLGKICLDEGKYNESINYLKRSLALKSDQVNTLYNLGLDYDKLKQNDHAILYYKKALKVDSTHIGSLNNLGNLYVDLKKYDEAIYYLERAHKLEPKHYATLQNLGIAYYYSGKYQKAIQVNRQQLREDPENAVIFGSMAKAYMRLKDYNNAIKAIENSIKLDPGIADMYVDLGSCYYSLGQWDKSIRNYKIALSMDPDNSTANQFLPLAEQRANSTKRMPYSIEQGSEN